MYLSHPMKPTTPTIIIDSREKTPLAFEFPTVKGGLYSGDYSLVGAENLFAVERKTLDDLAASCAGSRREVFEHELLRLRGYRFRRLLIIGTEADIHAHNYCSNITPNALLGSVLSFEVRYDIPLVWEPDAQAAARLIERWAQRFAREAMKVSYEISKGPAPSPVSTAKIPVTKA
jgi:ERCC4-type nuclease